MIPAILGNQFGFANVIMLGGVICAVGMFTSSFAPNIYVLYLTYGLVWGFGSCLCNCAALFVLPHFFSARIGLANGIVFFGAPVGTLANGHALCKPSDCVANNTSTFKCFYNTRSHSN